jgi:hypothetical protein
MVDLIIRRYFLAIHLPYFGLSLHDSRYAFTRRVVVETCLSIWRTTCPSPQPKSMHTCHDNTVSDQDLLPRLMVCDSDLSRGVAIQATFLIAEELKAEMEEEESLGPVSLRTDLISVLEEAKEWTMRRLKAGETSVKSHCYLSAVAAHIEGMRAGLQKEKHTAFLVKTVEDVADRCLPVFEEMAAKCFQEPTTAIQSHEMSENMQADMTGGWDLLVSWVCLVQIAARSPLDTDARKPIKL